MTVARVDITHGHLLGAVHTKSPGTLRRCTQVHVAQAKLLFAASTLDNLVALCAIAAESARATRICADLSLLANLQCRRTAGAHWPAHCSDKNVKSAQLSERCEQMLAAKHNVC